MGIEGIIAARSSKSSIGFGANVKSKEQLRQGELLKNLQVEDLIKFGMIPEFVGRLPVVTALEELDKDALVKILNEPKNAILKQYKKLFELNDAELEITEEGLDAIADKALKRGTGARGLRSILENLLLENMYNFSELENKHIRIDKDVVEEHSSAEISPRKVIKALKSTTRKRLVV